MQYIRLSKKLGDNKPIQIDRVATTDSFVAAVLTVQPTLHGTFLLWQIVVLGYKVT